jgi:hypothetical protein
MRVVADGGPIRWLLPGAFELLRFANVAAALWAT